MPVLVFDNWNIKDISSAKWLVDGTGCVVLELHDRNDQYNSNTTYKDEDLFWFVRVHGSLEIITNSIKMACPNMTFTKIQIKEAQANIDQILERLSKLPVLF